MRTIALVALAFALVAGLSACHRSDPGKLTPEQQQTFKGN